MIAFALMASIPAGGAEPAPGAVDGAGLRAQVLAAHEAAEVAHKGNDGKASAEADAALTELCGKLGYPDVATCVDIAKNEKWISTGSRGCVISAGRAWGCKAGAFAPPKPDK